MKRKSKIIKVCIILILTTLTIICTCLVLRKQYQSKIESKNISQRKEVTDKNTADSIENVLITVFKGRDAFDMDEFRKKYYYNFAMSFSNMTETAYNNFYTHALYQIEENKNRENIQTKIKLEKVYDLGNKQCEVVFWVEREFNPRNEPTIIKSKEHYYSKFNYSSKKILISELYDIDDFNNYLKRHKILSCFYTKKELVSKYLEYKNSLYNDLIEGHLYKDWFERHGYKI